MIDAQSTESTFYLVPENLNSTTQKLEIFFATKENQTLDEYKKLGWNPRSDLCIKLNKCPKKKWVKVRDSNEWITMIQAFSWFSCK